MLELKQRRKFIIATWEGGGSVGPALTVARKLVNAGHDVRVFSDACNKEESETTGARFRPWTSAPSRSDRSRESELIVDWQFDTVTRRIDHIFATIVVGPALQYATDLIRELKLEPADLVVASELVFGIAMGCEAANQRFALLTANSLQFPLAGAPQTGPVANRESMARDQQQQAAMLEEIGRVFAKHLLSLNNSRARLGLAPIGNVFDQLRPAKKTLIAVSRTFDFGPQADVPGFAYVGPQLDEATWTKPWCSPWPQDDNQPFVLVSFSTSFQNHVGILQRVVDALGRLPVNALVTLGPTIDPDEICTTDNIICLPSAPHDQVMREADLIVTHGGHGTIARAMANKLPMLVIPHGRDQDGNAERIVAHGAGLMLPPSALANDVEAALRQLLSDPSFLAAAKRLGREVEREIRDSRVVEELESLCALTSA